MRIDFFKEFKKIHDKIACFDRIFEMRFIFGIFMNNFD